MTLSEYIEQHCSPENPVLQQITRSTHLEVINPRMLSGHVQGRVLSMISQMIQPKRILELGTFTGYSALCLAEGLTEDGKLITNSIFSPNGESAKLRRILSSISSLCSMVISLPSSVSPSAKQRAE